MGVSDLDTGARERRLWNASNTVGPKRPLKPRMYGQSASF